VLLNEEANRTLSHSFYHNPITDGANQICLKRFFKFPFHISWDIYRDTNVLKPENTTNKNAVNYFFITMHY